MTDGLYGDAYQLEGEDRKWTTGSCGGGAFWQGRWRCRLRGAQAGVRRRSYQEIVAVLLTDAVEAAWLCGYPYLRYEDALSLLAMPVWKGAPRYCAYVVVAGRAVRAGTQRA